jgi:hypothetical protein
LNSCATVVWRRLDREGHEAARVASTASGWSLSGVVVVTDSARPCRLDYVISCDRGWRTERCVVTGFVGERDIRIDVARNAGGAWTVDGAPVAHLHRCEDIDLAFSPVTNLLPIRRLRLATGASALVRAAWLRFPELTMDVLEQTYTRLTPDRYLYESAGGTFRRELSVDASGFVLEYPGIWIAEARAGDIERE